jgi:poly-beta-1,6-N-acetyl-D-glucosamine synthase
MVTIMFYFIIIWVSFCILSLGPPVSIFLYMKLQSKKPWPTSVDKNYRPKISIIVPTYNESSIIRFKLINLSRLKYPKDLSEIIVVDSNSSDNTVEIVRQFLEKEKDHKTKIIVEEKRQGKSHALNNALQYCNGDVIIISDADCFWPDVLLEQALPFLADPTVGAISSPKILLNLNETWVTRVEGTFLKSAYLLRLGESKSGSTAFFEGGFACFKKDSLDRFDPYGTGSDDNGTVIGVIEKNNRAMLVPDGEFFATFPSSFGGKIDVKLRRANQLVRLFKKYLDLLVKRKLKNTKQTIIPNIFLYLFSPLAFLILVGLSVFLVSIFPWLLIFLFLLAFPQIRFYSYQLFENNILLLTATFEIIVGKSFTIWNKPDDRIWLTEKKLRESDLI